MVPETRMIIKTVEGWKKVSHNRGYDIIKLFKLLVKERFAASKAVLDMFCKKFCILLGSWAAERLKTFGN